MASRPRTPAHDAYVSIPTPSDPAHLSQGYGTGYQDRPSHHDPSKARSTDPAGQPGAPIGSSPLSQSVRQPQNPQFHEEFDAGGAPTRAHEHSIPPSNPTTPSRGGTLKKRASLSKKASLKRTGSKRGHRFGDIEGSLAVVEKERYDQGLEDEMKSATFTPVPTSGNPTEILSNRFQAWRKVLKDLVTYFRDIQISYESRAKALLKVSNVINNTNMPSQFLIKGGIGEATHILRDYHTQSIVECNKAKDIENDVIIQLNGLRSDLNQKIKEIKGLSGDFKNSVEKEMEGTRRAVNTLHEALGLIDSDPEAAAGKGDPYLVKLGVERQIERQIDEENYLHRAFLNLEGSGRELESIVLGEIQKAYNAYAGILKREADEAYDTVDKLRSGPVALAKDHEWNSFVEKDPHFVDPRLPIRRAEDIRYPGKSHPAATEVRAGMLERKGKYLKSYTPGWYVLSPTHLHEFKSADRIHSQPPVMSLFLPDQKLGSYSQPSSSSHKFMLKGRQTGSMHRGHSWVFRAESHDTMLAWYEDIKNLTEKSGEERNAFVRRHARSVSGGSQKAGSISSEGAMDEDEADQVPYSANASSVNQVSRERSTARRPQPGGRFPSDLQVNRDLRIPMSPSSESSDHDRDVIAEAGALPGSEMPSQAPGHREHSGAHPSNGQVSAATGATVLDTDRGRESELPEARPERGQSHHYDNSPHETTAAVYRNRLLPLDLQNTQGERQAATPLSSSAEQHGYMPRSEGPHHLGQRRHSNHGDWMGPAVVGAGGATVGVAGAHAYRNHEGQRALEHQPEAQDYQDVALAHSKRHEPSSQPAFEPRSPNAIPGENSSTQLGGISAWSDHRFEEGRPRSNYGEWMEPVVGTGAYRHQQQQENAAERAQPKMFEVASDQPTDFGDRTIQAESLSSASRLPATGSSQTNSETTISTTINSASVDKMTATAGSHSAITSNNHDATANSPQAAVWQTQSQNNSNPLDAATRPTLSARSNTNQSITELHVPGEYPPTPAPI
ncbi:MAG: hypothetical protein M1836_000194 [Candelina mexicana]|nr:MAG: hypothetical protein M1836_000194 [Candelina mexicana]